MAALVSDSGAGGSCRILPHRYSPAGMDDFLTSPPAAPAQPTVTPPITPNQTVTAHHLGQKGDILSLFGPSATSPAPPSAPTTPDVGMMGGLAPPPTSLILSNSFTEPGPVADPMDLDPLGDMFGAPAPPAELSPPQPTTFYIDESDSAKKEPSIEEEDTKKEEALPKKESERQEAPPQKQGFWSWWSKPKSEAGSKENILEDGEKKAEEGKQLFPYMAVALLIMITRTSCILSTFRVGLVSVSVEGGYMTSVMREPWPEVYPRHCWYWISDTT